MSFTVSKSQATDAEGSTSTIRLAGFANSDAPPSPRSPTALRTSGEFDFGTEVKDNQISSRVRSVSLSRNASRGRKHRSTSPYKREKEWQESHPITIPSSSNPDMVEGESSLADTIAGLLEEAAHAPTNTTFCAMDVLETLPMDIDTNNNWDQVATPCDEKLLRSSVSLPNTWSDTQRSTHEWLTCGRILEIVMQRKEETGQSYTPPLIPLNIMDSPPEQAHALWKDMIPMVHSELHANLNKLSYMGGQQKEVTHINTSIDPNTRAQVYMDEQLIGSHSYAHVQTNLGRNTSNAHANEAPTHIEERGNGLTSTLADVHRILAPERYMHTNATIHTQRAESPSDTNIHTASNTIPRTNGDSIKIADSIENTEKNTEMKNIGTNTAVFGTDLQPTPMMLRDL
eukprot:CFRG8191T1